jgi:hypothetical protein
MLHFSACQLECLILPLQIHIKFELVQMLGKRKYSPAQTKGTKWPSSYNLSQFDTDEETPFVLT